jgi:hypothetical protein
MFRPCWRRVATTVRMFSTKRLPALRSVPYLVLRHGMAYHSGRRFTIVGNSDASERSAWGNGATGILLALPALPSGVCFVSCSLLLPASCGGQPLACATSRSARPCIHGSAWPAFLTPLLAAASALAGRRSALAPLPADTPTHCALAERTSLSQSRSAHSSAAPSRRAFPA